MKSNVLDRGFWFGFTLEKNCYGLCIVCIYTSPKLARWSMAILSYSLIIPLRWFLLVAMLRTCRILSIRSSLARCRYFLWEGYRTTQLSSYCNYLYAYLVLCVSHILIDTPFSVFIVNGTFFSIVRDYCLSMEIIEMFVSYEESIGTGSRLLRMVININVNRTACWFKLYVWV